MKKQQVIKQIKWFDNSIGQYAHTRQRNHIKHRIWNQYSPYRIRIASHRNCGRKSGVWWCRGGLWNVKSEMWWNENGITSTHTHTLMQLNMRARTHTDKHISKSKNRAFSEPLPLTSTPSQRTNEKPWEREASEVNAVQPPASGPVHPQMSKMKWCQNFKKDQWKSLYLVKENITITNWRYATTTRHDYNGWKAGKSWYLRRYTTSIQKLKKRKRKIDKKPKQKKVEKRNVDVSCLVFATLVPTSNFQILIIFDVESLMVNFSKIKFKVFKNHEFS